DSARLLRVELKLDALGRLSMAAFDDIKAQLDAANASLDGIQSDITALKDQIAAAGSNPTPDQMAALLAQATALAAKAGGIDAETPGPPPPPPPGRRRLAGAGGSGGPSRARLSSPARSLRY